jgi:predicted nucleotidyltransferase component of viral defense system
MLYLELLNQNQLDLLKELDLPSNEVYLAGGTALALQLGHRTSLDFDFYSKKDFDPEILIAKFKDKFKNNMIVNRIAKGTAILTINNVSFSLFYYPYNLIGDLIDLDNIKVTSIPDVSAMKLIAVAMRGKRRDFIDVYYLLKKYSLKELLSFVKQKYPSFEELMILKGLIFFEDAENEDVARGIKIFDNSFSWKEAKRFIEEEVKKYQLDMLTKV